jgi:hypothetical protein
VSETLTLREPKGTPEKAHFDRCDGRTGEVRTRGQQDCVFCTTCGSFLYNAPRVETGKETRTVTTIHNGIKPKQRARILMRANGACELCHGSDVPLHVGHMVGVLHGFANGLTEEIINDDENLCAMCEECNLGVGKDPVPLRLMVALLIARAKREQ